MPADRAFSQVEREMKTHDTIILPDEYDQFISNKGNLFRLGSNGIPVYDFKAMANQLLKVSICNVT